MAKFGPGNSKTTMRTVLGKIGEHFVLIGKYETCKRFIQNGTGQIGGRFVLIQKYEIESKRDCEQLANFLCRLNQKGTGENGRAFCAH